MIARRTFIKSASMAALATLFTLQFRRLLLIAAPGLGDQLGYWEQRALTVVVILLLAAVNIRGVTMLARPEILRIWRRPS